MALCDYRLFQRLSNRLLSWFRTMQLCRVSALFSHSVVCQEGRTQKKRVVIVYVVPPASSERSRWSGVPGGRRNGAIRLSVACEKQKHLPK